MVMRAQKVEMQMTRVSLWMKVFESKDGPLGSC